MRFPEITDVQPGSYVVMDGQYGAVEGVNFEQALTVLASVISVRDTWAVVDAATNRSAAMPGHRGSCATRGVRIGGRRARQIGLPGKPDVELGATVEIVPSHCDTTVNLYDEFVVHRNGVEVDPWPILTRGRVR